MFGSPKKEVPAFDESSNSLRMREMLFGDMAWVSWAGKGRDKPWTSFAAARESAEFGNKADAAKQLREILATKGLESRHYLQAWHCLRELGEKPQADEAKHVYGVIIEVGMPGGLDVLAAYEDGTARYWNFSGVGIVWDEPNDFTVKQAVAEVLDKAERVIGQIGAWDKPRPPPPGQGIVRLNILAPTGLHFGQARVEAMGKDPLGGPLFLAGAQLMKVLTAYAGKPGDNVGRGGARKNP